MIEIQLLTFVLSIAAPAIIGIGATFILLRHLNAQKLEASSQQATASLTQLNDLETHAQDLSRQLTEAQIELTRATERVTFLESFQTKFDTLSQEHQNLVREYDEIKVSVAHERKNFEEKIALLEQAKTEFSDAFKALSSEALSKNNQNFMNLAQSTLEKFHEAAKGDMKTTQKSFAELVSPMKDALGQVNQRMEDLEKSRVGAYEGLKQQVQGLMSSQKELKSETSKLVQALRTPNVRGRWGEIQLKRVVEMSGMSAHCDFAEQNSLDREDGGKSRPDLIVNLPNKKCIIIDAKTPLSAYLNGIESQSEVDRIQHFKEHARHVRSHINQLSSRSYWSQLPKDLETPEFVVLFLPGEPFFTTALEYDPNLIEDGVQKNVIIATPATLIALLHAVAYGWRQESLANNARHISELGKDLYKRISDMGAHMSRMGTQLSSTIETYNKTVGTMERRVLPTARKFHELQSIDGGKDGDGLPGTSAGSSIPELTAIDKSPRTIQAPELLQQASGE